MTVLLRVDNSKPNRRQRVGDASSPDPGDSVVSRDKPFGAAIDRRMSIGLALPRASIGPA
jgi:hypothetical protein